MKNYSAKLTAEPFLYNETKIIGKYLLEGYDVNELKKKNIEENLIQYKSAKSILRVNSPIFRRLSVLNEKLLEAFVLDDVNFSRMLLIYAIMKTDNLVKDFIFEIYQEKILTMKDYIEPFEINNWFERIYAESNLDVVSPTTKYKLKQVTLRIMMDSGLLAKEPDKFKIIIPILNEKFRKLLSEAGDIEYYKALGGII